MDQRNRNGQRVEVGGTQTEMIDRSGQQRVGSPVRLITLLALVLTPWRAAATRGLVMVMEML
jgi:hypothetical protein